MLIWGNKTSLLQEILNFCSAKVSEGGGAESPTQTLADKHIEAIQHLNFHCLSWEINTCNNLFHSVLQTLIFNL